MAALPKVAQYAPLVFSAVKTFTGVDPSGEPPKDLAKVMSSLDFGMGGTASPTVAPAPSQAAIGPTFANRMTTHFNQYGEMASAARGMANNIFGNQQNAQQIQQAMGSMGPNLGMLGDKGLTTPTCILIT